MKELSIEEKAKAYDEALERMKSWARGEHPECFTEAQKAAEFIFPELKESEDERIRKSIIKFLIDVNNGAYTKSELEIASWIAWLEKQEQKPQGKSVLEAIKEEKADNQNCVKSYAQEHIGDNIEPKFHEGEWIIHQGTENIYQVVARIDNQYQLKYGDNYTVQKCADVDRCARLWDITKDAKDGDVLAEDSCIFIIQKLGDNSTSAKTYCTLYDDGDFDIDNGSILHFDINSTKPATKEQRDLLFQKMKEAGYVWDAEKKELKKMEQKQVIDYSDSFPKDNWELIHEFVKKFGRIPKDEDELNVLIEYVLKRQKPAWSEEDDIYIENIILAVEKQYPIAAKELTSWLNFLKDRYTWKPSDEQMRVLDLAIRCGINRGTTEETILVSLFNDLKKLKA